MWNKSDAGSLKFKFKLLISDKIEDGYYNLKVWVDEPDLGEGNEEWVRRAIEDYNLLEDFGYKMSEEQNWYICGEGSIKGWYDYWGEYDEELDLEYAHIEEVPDSFFGRKYETES